MNTENEINEEVRRLLDSLEEHGKNACRQKELGDLIDQLSEKELGTGTSLRGTKQSRKQVDPLDCFVVPPRNDAKRRKLYPLWWAMGAAAACLLLWLLIKPNAKQQPEREQEILVEETKTVDSVKVNDAVFVQPVANEAFLAEETPLVPQKAPMKKKKSKTQIIEEVLEQPLLAEVKPTETKDTMNIGSNTIPTTNEMPSVVQKPQRRVIRSLNLVCYECQKEPEHEFSTKSNVDNRTLFGQPQDPNMKNGSLALEIKLN
ncbi:MAG: hypothetical protein K6G25_03770 [Bacteroidales bacterium]|nr:hypothetical protein [Bacteroidales bacterium]